METYLAAGGQLMYDGVIYSQGNICGYRLSFRMETTITSAIAATEAGVALAGPYGFLVRSTINNEFKNINKKPNTGFKRADYS